MSQWGTCDTGILRKNRPTENLDELLVFGYACKLFRDDERALHIDQGKHLIPWMGDDNLKIDRYDCRGALSSIKQYEASREGYAATRWLGLSEADRKLEELCDKERYYSLEINEEEEEMYKEEEQKRKQTNAIQYSYDVPNENESQNKVLTAEPKEEEDEEYVPLPSLDVPINIEIPKTVKEYARMEKTALFVCKQGPQMEILLKAKQADNQQFSFLNQGDKLNKFYRHLVSAFKNGRYLPQCDGKKEDEKDEVTQPQEQNGEYLHPSLSTTSKTEQTTSIVTTMPSIPYRPSANCAYFQLVNRIQGNNQLEQQAAPQLPAEQMTVEQQQYYMYYYVQQYYEYYKQMMQASGNEHMVQLPDQFQQLDPNMQNYIQQLAYSQYMQQQQQQQTQSANNSPYAQIVSNVNKDSVNAYTANVPQLPKEIKQEDTSIKKPLLSLAAAYASDSESDAEENEDEPKIKEEVREVYNVPTGDVQTVIDKMAAYVSKNGDQFEDIVKAKGDPRFEFLHETHEYYKYYKEKIAEMKRIASGNNQDADQKENIIVKEEKDIVSVKKEEIVKKSPQKPKKVILPVSFSIKKPKEDPPKEIKSALPVEESDEEEEFDNKEKTSQSSPIKNSVPVMPGSMNGFVKDEVVSPDIGSKNNSELENGGRHVNNNSLLDPDDPIFEMMSLTGSVDLIKEAKRAEDRIKDKLVAAAREKLQATVARDRALQLERKRRAAEFLKMKSVTVNPVIVPEKAAKPNTPPRPSPIRSPVSRRSCSSSRSSVEIIEVKSRSRSRDRSRRKDSSDERKKESKSRSRTPRAEYSRERKSKKKKSHKRKRSQTRHSSKSRKKSKKHRRKSESYSSSDSS